MTEPFRILSVNGGSFIAVFAAAFLGGCTTVHPQLGTMIRNHEAGCDGSKLLVAKSIAAKDLISLTRADIERRVQQVLVSALEISPALAVNSANLACDVKADSLEMIEVVMALEEEFGIEISDQDVDRYVWSFNNIVTYVEGRLAEARRA